MCCATIMAASTMAMSANAATKYPDFSSKQISKSQWELTTGTNKRNCSVSVSGTGKYYKTKTTLGKTGGGNGGNGGCTYTLFNPYYHGWIEAISDHYAQGYRTKLGFKSAKDARYVANNKHTP